MESKLKITFRKGEIEIAGNREELRDLADICNGLSELSEEQANTPANHWHIADFIMKDGMETDVLESSDIFYLSQILAIAVAQ